MPTHRKPYTLVDGHGIILSSVNTKSIHQLKGREGARISNFRSFICRHGIAHKGAHVFWPRKFVFFHYEHFYSQKVTLFVTALIFCKLHFCDQEKIEKYRSLRPTHSNDNMTSDEIPLWILLFSYILTHCKNIETTAQSILFLQNRFKNLFSTWH